MNTKRFNAGDTVRLKIGGVKMTVQGYARKVDKYLKLDYSYVICSWQDGSNQAQTESYHVDSLELIRENIITPK